MGGLFREGRRARKRGPVPINNFVRLWLLCAAPALLA
jgi:hypothetical protein